MSYESKHIDGDVSVGRNTAIGGDATVQGKTHLKGNVMVDGWLEAKNIKGVSKGLFTTIEKLKAAYPLPHDGWWALVGVSLPAPIYVGDGGEWVPTGQSGGNPTIDSGQYNEAVEKLQEDITKLQDDITDIEARNKAQDTNLTTLGDSVNSLQDQVNTTKDTANKANNKANEVGSQLNSFKESKGENGGIAPLDEQGKVPSRHLPGYIAVVPDCFYGHFYTFTCKLTHDSVTYNAYKEIHCAVDVLIRQSFFLLHGFKGGQGFVEVLLILSLVLFLLGDSFRKFLVGGCKCLLLFGVFKCGLEIIPEFAHHTDDRVFAFSPVSKESGTLRVACKQVGQCFFTFLVTGQFLVVTIVIVIDLTE